MRIRSITYLMSKNLNSSTKIKQHMITTLKNCNTYYSNNYTVNIKNIKEA